MNSFISVHKWNTYLGPLKQFSRTMFLQVRLEGLEIMNDDPSEVDVLYAKVIIISYYRFVSEMIGSC